MPFYILIIVLAIFGVIMVALFAVALYLVLFIILILIGILYLMDNIIKKYGLKGKISCFLLIAFICCIPLGLFAYQSPLAQAHINSDKIVTICEATSDFVWNHHNTSVQINKGDIIVLDENNGDSIHIDLYNKSLNTHISFADNNISSTNYAVTKYPLNIGCELEHQKYCMIEDNWKNNKSLNLDEILSDIDAYNSEISGFNYIQIYQKQMIGNEYLDNTVERIDPKPGDKFEQTRIRILNNSELLCITEKYVMQDFHDWAEPLREDEMVEKAEIKYQYELDKTIFGYVYIKYNNEKYKLNIDTLSNSVEDIEIY